MRKSWVLVFLMVGCGGGDAAPAPKAPAREESAADKERVPSTIQEAQDAIAQARAELEGPTGDGFRKADESRDRDAPAKTPAQPQGGATKREEPPSPSTATSACGGSCRALASMRRAVEALCRMTGDEDNRCTGAKKTLAESTTKVAQQSCKCDAQ